MAENMPENETKDGSTRHGLSRRQFLIRSGVAAGAGAGLISYENIKGFSGVETDAGVFIPLYERHDVGIEPQNLPRETNVYFREFAFLPDSRVGLMDASAKEILEATATVYENTPLKAEIRVFPDEVLNVLSSIGAEIMVGDVNVGPYSNKRKSLVVYVAGALLGIAPETITKMPRRRFLQWLGRISLLWNLPPIYTNLLKYLPVGSSKEQDAAKRITARIEGITSDFHPENVVLFFRNAVMATKMLSVAAEIRDSSGGKLPKFAFQVEKGHSGIEDFLQLGADSCRNLILMYPKDFLQEITSTNGGVEQFCTARLFKLPKSFHTVGGTIPDDVASLITERKVVDTKLKERLEKVLSG